MRLLLDQNLSYKNCKQISDVFEDVKHVSDLGLIAADDITIWNFAKNNNYSIVTFDSDFIDISALHGFPPKIIWLRIGNSSTKNTVDFIKKNAEPLRDFLVNNENAFLEIG